MSSSTTKANPLLLQETLRDLALLRASDVDLSALVASIKPTGVDDHRTTVDAAVARSYQFVREARAAIKVESRGDVVVEGDRLEAVRVVLEDAVTGLDGTA
ncbi:hypothetical protein BV25DRAFT_1810286 [Artomyces pyxidatus]|uniref:Uncharacterized protein n=1 Tax=Artomyces pyxidatus TaxID=48021 RepID=A0ACB8SQQ0_9AGAM|nr:hypothetical protein BV25DRAFT_1810286 [Artomyces pyxidatus]